VHCSYDVCRRLSVRSYGVRGRKQAHSRRCYRRREARSCPSGHCPVWPLQSVSLNQTHQIRCLPYLLCCGSLSSLDLFGAGMAPTVSLSSRSRLSRSNFPKSLRSTAQRAELPWSNLVIARLLSLCDAMIMTAHTGTATRVPPLRLRLPSTRSL
jgi:hypothetical protein